MGDFFKWSRVFEFFPKVLAKFPVTLEIVLGSFLIGLLLGAIIAVIRIKKIPVLSQLCAVYVSYIRGTPILVQLFVAYYGVPQLLTSVAHVDVSTWDKMFYVFFAYGLNQSGFLSEIIRGAINSIDSVQTEAAYSVGLTELQTFIRIIFPQAARIALPSMGTTFITLFRSTALAYMLGVIDIMGKAKNIGVTTYHTMEGYVDAAIIFIVVSIFFEQVFNQINKRLDYGRSREVKTVKVKKEVLVNEV